MTEDAGAQVILVEILPSDPQTSVFKVTVVIKLAPLQTLSEYVLATALPPTHELYLKEEVAGAGAGEQVFNGTTCGFVKLLVDGIAVPQLTSL